MSVKEIKDYKSSDHYNYAGSQLTASSDMASNAIEKYSKKLPLLNLI